MSLKNRLRRFVEREGQFIFLTFSGDEMNGSGAGTECILLRGPEGYHGDYPVLSREQGQTEEEWQQAKTDFMQAVSNGNG